MSPSNIIKRVHFLFVLDILTEHIHNTLYLYHTYHIYIGIIILFNYPFQLTINKELVCFHSLFFVFFFTFFDWQDPWFVRPLWNTIHSVDTHTVFRPVVVRSATSQAENFTPKRRCGKILSINRTKRKKKPMICKKFEFLTVKWSALAVWSLCMHCMKYFSNALPSPPVNPYCFVLVNNKKVLEFIQFFVLIVGLD